MAGGFVNLPGHGVPEQGGAAAARGGGVVAGEREEGTPGAADARVAGNQGLERAEELPLALAGAVVPAAPEGPDGRGGGAIRPGLGLAPEGQVKKLVALPEDAAVQPAGLAPEGPEDPCLLEVGPAGMGVEGRPAVDRLLGAAALDEQGPKVARFGVGGERRLVPGAAEQRPEEVVVLEARTARGGAACPRAPRAAAAAGARSRGARTGGCWSPRGRFRSRRGARPTSRSGCPGLPGQRATAERWSWRRDVSPPRAAGRASRTLPRATVCCGRCRGWGRAPDSSGQARPRPVGTRRGTRRVRVRSLVPGRWPRRRGRGRPRRRSSGTRQGPGAG